MQVDLDKVEALDKPELPISVKGSGFRNNDLWSMFDADKRELGEIWNPDAAAYIVAACNAIPALIARVRELEAERRWIPVREGLPKPGKSGDYFVIEELPMGLRCVAIRTWLHDRSTCGWQRPSGFPVTHWRPIGPLPEGHE